MDQDEKRTVVTVEVDSQIKRWLEIKSAQRIIDGRPFGERSVGAVIRDMLVAAHAEDRSVAA